MKVFRLHIRPKGGDADPKVSFDYCLKHHLLGMGWGISAKSSSSVDWETYLRAAKRIHGRTNLSRVIFFKEKVKQGDLIWTRDSEGNYFVARVKGRWRYLQTKESVRADILNVVSCKLVPVKHVDDVPGKIIACFRPTRTIQRIRDESAVLYSQLLWNKLTRSKRYRLEGNDHSNSLYSFLNAEQCEDIVFIYLQTKGWIVVPNSRRADTMRYKYILINNNTLQRAVVQVKTGKTLLRVADWKGIADKVYLFQSEGRYEGVKTEGIILLSPKKLESFMLANQSLLPSSIGRWVDFYKSRKH